MQSPKCDDIVPEAVPRHDFCVYVAAKDFVAELLHELGKRVCTVRQNLVFAHGEPTPAAWAQNVWHTPQWYTIDSIAHAARQLRSLQRNWHLHPLTLFRRAQLIQDALPPVACRPHIFGAPLPTAPLGAWTLWDATRILASPVTASPFAHGNVTFVENKTDPPGRAYLKLWEVFTLLEKRPVPGDLCLDLGSAPRWLDVGIGEVGRARVQFG